MIPFSKLKVHKIQQWYILTKIIVKVKSRKKGRILIYLRVNCELLWEFLEILRLVCLK